MPNLADIAGLVTPDLIRRNVEMAACLGLSHRKSRRILGQKYVAPTGDDHVIKPGDFPAIERSVATMDEASAMLSANAEVFETILAFLADQNERRPAPVLRIVPRSDPPTVSPQPEAPRIGIVARLWARLSGSPTAAAA
nr:hypothetical protein [Methylobacterium sp. L1A1]